MRLGDLLSGSPFRTAARVACGVFFLLGVSGVLLVQSVTTTLRGEVEDQTLEEALLLRDIYDARGRDGLVQAIEDLERFFGGPRRVSGVFDENGLNLAGPIRTAPDFVGLRESSASQLIGETREGRFLLSVQKIDRTTLVVGRSLIGVQRTRNRLVLGLSALTLFLTFGTLALGLLASRRNFAKLQAMEATLAQIAQGQTDRRLPIGRDRDQIDRISVQMNTNLDRLSRLMAGMKSTASAIAHDLKTPLSHTQIALHQAADACEQGTDPLPGIETALRETGNLNEIFDTILRISRIQATPPRPDRAALDLAELAVNTVEFLTPLAEENGQSLQCEAQEPAKLRCDKTMVQQALVNLVTNAIAHSGRGAAISVAAKDLGDRVRLEVSDNGPGIPPEHRATVLDPFKRLDSARSAPGSGLGLALVKAVAEHHGARLDLSDADPGLKVTLTFPRETGELGQ